MEPLLLTQYYTQAADTESVRLRLLAQLLRYSDPRTLVSCICSRYVLFRWVNIIADTLANAHTFNIFPRVEDNTTVIGH